MIVCSSLSSLANKQDLPKVMTPVEIKTRFDKALRNVVHEVFPVSARQPLAMSGLPEAFNWLGDALKNGLTNTSNPVKVSSPTQAVQPRSSPSPLSEKFESILKRSAVDDDTDPHEFLDQFHNVSLPGWDHYVHIRLAFLILTIYGRQTGKKIIFKSCPVNSTFHLL
jgi:hypothetical protein